VDKLKAKNNVHLQPTRLDQLPDNVDNFVGRIIRRIHSDNVIFAVLSEHDTSVVNANCYYELGVAHGFGRPVVMLLHEAAKVPSDLNKQEIFQYSDTHLNNAADVWMQPGAPGDRAYKFLAGKLSGPRTELFGDPFGMPEFRSGRSRTMDRFRDVTYNELSNALLSAEREIWIAGATLAQFVDPDKGPVWPMPAPLNDDGSGGQLQGKHMIADPLTVAVAKGVRVRILIMHPDNAFHQVRLRWNGADDLSPSSLRDRLRVRKSRTAKSYNAWLATARQVEANVMKARKELRLAPQLTGSMTVRQIRSRAILHRFIATEDVAYVTPNFYSFGYNSGPSVFARRHTGPADSFSTDWYQSSVDELEKLWSLSEVEAIPAKLPGASRRSWLGRKSS
jgi:hypothetical protein